MMTHTKGDPPCAEKKNILETINNLSLSAGYIYPFLYKVLLNSSSVRENKTSQNEFMLLVNNLLSEEFCQALHGVPSGTVVESREDIRIHMQIRVE